MTTWPSQMTLVGTILGWMPFFMSPLPLAPRLLRVGRGSVMSGGPQRGLRAPLRRAAREMLAHGAERARLAGVRQAGPPQLDLALTWRFTRVTIAPIPRSLRGEISSARPICW